MPEYQFVAKDFGGKTIKSSLEAENLDAFYRILAERNQLCVSVREAGIMSANINLTPKKLKLQQLAIFARQFSTMLTAGMTVIKCLDVLYQQTADKFMKQTILGVYEAVQKGDTLSKAMKAQKDAFPPLFLNMVAAGEAGGTLDSVMLRMASQYEKDYKTQNKVKSALVYPCFLAGLTVVVVIFLITVILPKFSSMLTQNGGQMPATTQFLLNLSGSLTNYWYIHILVWTVIIGGLFMWIRTDKGRLTWDNLKIKVPLFGKINLVIYASNFARTLASLYSSGVPIVQSLEIVAQVITNKFVQTKIQKVSEDVRRGVTLSTSVRNVGVFPNMLCSMLTIGEESGNLDDILTKTSAFYDEESDSAISRMIALIEPIMIVVMAVIIGFIMISIMQPIFGVYSAVNQNANKM